MSTELQPNTGPADTSSVELAAAEPSSNDLNYKPDEKQEEKADKPLDRRAAIEKAQAEVAAKEAEKAKEPPKEEPKRPEKVEAKAEPKQEPKPEDKPVEKNTQSEKSDSVERAAQEGERPKSSEGKVSEAPARFLPRAKELWANTPNPVKEEVHRAISEYEESAKQYQAVAQEWETIKHYDQMAKTHGTTIREALDRYTSIDKLLHSNPVAGLTEVFKIAGVDPRQFAQQILGQQAQPGQPGQQQPARDPQVVNVVTQQQQAIQQLNAKIQQMEEAQRIAQVNNTLIEPFKADHPRYAELEGHMATILQSGLVPQNLTPWQRLEAAYDMAERLNPRSMSAQPAAPSGPVPEEPRQSAAGGKSIKGAPSPGTSVDRTGQKLDRKAAIRAAMAELGH